MSIRLESNIDHFPRSQPHPAEEHCPLCDQVLPHDITTKELQARLQEKEQKAAAVHEKRLKAESAQELKETVEEVKKQAAVEAADREKVIRSEVQAQATKAFKGDISKAEQEKAQAQAEKKAAEDRFTQLKAQQDQQTKQDVQKALQDQREALESEKITAIQKVQAQEFEKNQKLQRQMEALKRQIEQKTAEDLGEGAEVDLYEALREHFDGDTIERIKKGQPGADILHEIVHNGKVCGSIIYDSKNHGAWRSNFVEKLKTDQLAAKADHAILTTSAFPAGARQLQVKDDVIVLNPARVVEMVRIVREHIVQTHRLRLSAEEREKKTEALYEFINSDRCRQLMARHETITEELLTIEVKEVKTHEATWKKRGQLIRGVQKLHGDYLAEIDRIIEDGSFQ